MIFATLDSMEDRNSMVKQSEAWKFFSPVYYGDYLHNKFQKCLAFNIKSRESEIKTLGHCAFL